MNLNIREIDPEARGLLYRLQAEQNLSNLAETIKFLVKNYYVKGSDTLTRVEAADEVTNSALRCG